MNKRQTEVEKAKLAAEKRELNHLRAIYKRSLNDVLKKIAISDGKISVLLSQIDDLDDEGKSILQSQIYQKKFQQNLQKQLDTFYSELVRDQHDSMQAYLRKCYDMGFVGSIYDMHGQGVPIISQISQKNVIKAMNINSKISTSLYQRLGEDVQLLKKKIANSISRGIATASSYSTIAINLAEHSNVGINRAMRIARTEGHRIQAESALDAQYAARDAGADVVKQWDSTLDGRTRRSHRELDGQIRELDDPFEVGGKTAMHPSGFGIAGEDINCRCALLQRARWALDGDELEILKEKARFHGLAVNDSKAYGHEKAKDFADFQKKYMKAAGSGAKAIANTGKRNIIKSIDIDDFAVGVANRSVSKEVQDVFTETIRKLENQGNFMISEVKFGEFYDEYGKTALLQIDLDQFDRMIINFNSAYMAGKSLEEINKAIATTDVNLAKDFVEAIVHESGHAKAYFGKTRKQIEEMNKAIKDAKIEGVSAIAYLDGAECIAEVELLIYRGEEVPEKALELYNKYVKR